MPFDGRIYDPERDAASGAEAETVGRAATVAERRPETLAPSDLTGALLTEIDSPELADMAALLIGQADALERHYPAATPVALPERVRPAASERTTRRARGWAAAAVVALSTGAALAAWSSGAVVAPTTPKTPAPVARAAKSVAPAETFAGVASPSVAPAIPAEEVAPPAEPAPRTAAREPAAADREKVAESLLNSLLELDGSAREGLIDLEESGDVPPGRFSL